MSFKLKSPYVDNTVPVFKVPMERGVYGKANNDTSSNSGFNIHVNQNINDTPTYLKVVEHENGHIDQMARGDMDYDDKYVYWKGQKIPRANMPEGAHDLPWEKEIYDKSPVNMKLRNGSGNHPAFANLSERGLIKSHAMLAEGDEKKTREHKRDINPETGMKRLTITTTTSGGSGGTVPYSEAYKKADKTKYPTLDKFISAAKAYKQKDVKVSEQIPTRKAEILTQPKPRTIDIEKVKEPRDPEIEKDMEKYYKQRGKAMKKKLKSKNTRQKVGPSIIKSSVCKPGDCPTFG